MIKNYLNKRIVDYRKLLYVIELIFSRIFYVSLHRQNLVDIIIIISGNIIIWNIIKYLNIFYLEENNL